MRQTKTVSIWPVGFVGGLRWEGPVCKNDKIVDFRVVFKPNREIPVDMAGFALNAELVVKNPQLKFDPRIAETGYSESTFLSIVASRNSVESLGDLCNKVTNKNKKNVIICPFFVHTHAPFILYLAL